MFDEDFLDFPITSAVLNTCPKVNSSSHLPLLGPNSPQAPCFSYIGYSEVLGFYPMDTAVLESHQPQAETPEPHMVDSQNTMKSF